MPEYDVVVIGAGNGGLTARSPWQRRGARCCCSNVTTCREAVQRALCAAGSSSRWHSISSAAWALQRGLGP
jgi:pyruvate/2-oxoglutarate dehydrogenase complex dihydrolipoamide dehydrogenase (E3) component